MAVNLRNDDAIARELRNLQTIALKLENYDGSNPCADWLSDFDRYVTETARDSDEAKLFSLIYHLTGTTKEWFNLLSDDIKESYKKLRDALQTTFSPTPQEVFKVKAQLYNSKQQPSEPYQDYVRRLQLQAHIIKLPDEDLVPLCVNGALPSLRLHLQMANTKSMQELLNLPIVTSNIEEELLEYMFTRFKDIDAKTKKNVPDPSAPYPYTVPKPGPRRKYRFKDQWTVHNTHEQSVMQTRTRPRQFPKPKPIVCNKCAGHCQGNQKCPAYNKTCFRCGGHHHFKIACRSKVNGLNLFNKHDRLPAQPQPFFRRSGQSTRSFTGKQPNSYKPSLVQKPRKMNVHVQTDKNHDFQNNVAENVIHKVSLNDKRCHDNTLRVTIGNVRSVALVDTGASISCLSTALLCNINPNKIKYLQTDIQKIYGVGDIVQDVSHKVQVKFHIDDHQFQHQFYIIQNQYPIILGMDFITQHNGVLDFGNSTITLSDNTYDLTPPPRRSTLVKSQFSEIIDAYSSRDIPVRLTRPVETTCMLVEPISSLTRIAPGLEIPLALVSSQSTVCRVTNDTDTPLSVPAGCVMAIARSVTVNSITEMIDFLDRDSEIVLQINPNDQAQVDDNDDFNAIMPFPDLAQDDSSNPDDNPKFDIDNPTLSAREVAELVAFLIRNKKAFASTLARLGYTSEFYHTIDTGDAKPVALRFYRTSPKIQKEIDNQIEELLKYGIIEPSTSAWSSPIVMVRKPDNSYRMAIDYRLVNKVTSPQNFPVPRLSDVFDQIGESKPKFFSTLDMQSGFWQIPVHPDDQDKTAFVTKNAKYKFKRLPFGLKGAPSTFQQMTSTVLKDLLGKCCCVYADDILCYSPDLKTHMEDLQKIFNRLIAAGLTLKPSKCKIAVQNVKYLGHILSPKGIRPNPEKVEVIKNYPIPKTVTQVRRFLGMTQYYRRFQTNYANLAKPLQNLTKNDVEYKWTDSCQKSFDKLIENLTTAPLLAYPDCNKPFILSCDASDVAIGFILSQYGEDSLEHVIEYAGRSLRKSELNYTVTDKEALAIVEGFRKFHTYLYGNHTTVITDHQALEHVYKNPKLTGRIARWNILLQNYDYTVIYKKGKHNTNADAVSRLDNLPRPDNDNPDDIEPRHMDLFVVDPDPVDIIHKEDVFREYVLFEESEPEIPSVMHINDIDIVKAQKECPEIGPIYEFIKSGTISDDLKPSIIADESQYFIKNKVLHHLYQPRVRNLQRHKPLTSQIVVPKQLRPLILSEYHDALVGGHQGYLRTYAAIRDKYHWPRMYADILEYQQSCQPCQRASNYHPRPPPLGQFPPFTNYTLFSRMHMDILGPLRESHNKEKYILLVMDAFSKWPEAFALQSADAITVAQVLYKEIFTRYGAPNVLISDRGQCFMSNLVKALSALFGVKRNMTTPFHPSSNSACERVNSQINRALRTYVNADQLDWPSILPGIMMAFRNTPADNSTEFSPFFLLFCQHMRTPLDIAIQGNIPDVTPQFRTDLKTFMDNVKLSRHIANENMERHLEMNKMRYDDKAKDVQFRVGQYVWLYNPAVPVGLSRKLRPKWCGPYIISEVHDNNRYRIRHYHSNLESPTLINGARLKKARLHNESAIRNYVEQQRRQNGIPVIPDKNPRQNVNNDEADNDPDDQNTPLPPVEKVVDLARNNKGKWYRVKFQGRPGTKWVQTEFVNIPQRLIDTCLTRRTWQGTPRKRRRKHKQ